MKIKCFQEKSEFFHDR